MRRGDDTMNAAPSSQWLDANRRYLAAAVVGVRARLEEEIARKQGAAPAQFERAEWPELVAIEQAMPAPPAIEHLRTVFGLSSFECGVLLLCAAMELDAAIARLCATAQGDPSRPYPTFSLALVTMPFPHWSALAASGPLRHWRLIDVGTGNALTLSPLKINERVLHYLAGVPDLDQRLLGIVEPMPPPVGLLVPSHQTIAERLATIWSGAGTAAPLPLIQLNGPEPASKRAIAGAACEAIGVRLHLMYADALPATASDLDPLIRLWEREAALEASACYLDCEELDLADAARASAAMRLIDRMSAPLVVASRERWRIRQRPAIAFDIEKPKQHEQYAVWQSALGATAARLNGHVEALVSQFSLGAPAIAAASAEALGEPGAADDRSLGGLLWDACRAQARPRLDDLAQRIEHAATWDDLVLPEAQRHVLREIGVHVRQRAKVYDGWGFGARGTRGLGISAMFAGASGTGKTMAAEVLASELRLDLYRIDLSSVVSKYIGETEKNLRRVFDAAEDGGAILLFDEADALFGKRSEVKDSHDRYANIEVSYLLQRMEAYRGLAILTTNLRGALDTAFLRRIRFVVQFPFPDAAQRAEIWRRVFPAATPTEGLDVDALARLNVAGGNIRNIAINAAFLAADAGEPVRMATILRAAQGEYAKLEKPLTEAEVGRWA
jgi:hypothetical protein